MHGAFGPPISACGYNHSITLVQHENQIARSFSSKALSTGGVRRSRNKLNGKRTARGWFTKCISGRAPSKFRVSAPCRIYSAVFSKPSCCIIAQFSWGQIYASTLAKQLGGSWRKGFLENIGKCSIERDINFYVVHISVCTVFLVCEIL